MSVRIEKLDKDGGRWVVCGNTQTELETGILALHTALDKKDRPVTNRGPGRPPKNGLAKNKERELARIKTGLAILRAINEAGKPGADASSLVAAAGIPEGKALGSIMGMMGRLLRSMGLTHKSVYVVRGFERHKRWIPQSNISAAIMQFEEMEKTSSH